MKKMPKLDKIDKIDIDGTLFKVEVNETGDFWTEWQDETVKSNTLKGLSELLRKRIRAERAHKPVEVVKIERRAHSGWRGPAGVVITPGVVTGIHGGNDNILFQHHRKDGKKYTEQLYGSKELYRPLSDAEVVELRDLNAAADIAETAVESWLKKRQIDVRAVLAAQLDSSSKA